MSVRQAKHGITPIFVYEKNTLITPLSICSFGDGDKMDGNLFEMALQVVVHFELQRDTGFRWGD